MVKRQFKIRKERRPYDVRDRWPLPSLICNFLTAGSSSLGGQGAGDRRLQVAGTALAVTTGKTNNTTKQTTVPIATKFQTE